MFHRTIVHNVRNLIIGTQISLAGVLGILGEVVIEGLDLSGVTWLMDGLMFPADKH